MNLGFFVGMALGGILVDWYWRLFSSSATGLTTLLYGFLVLFLIPETRPDGEAVEASAAAGPPVPEGAPGPWRDGVFLAVCLGSVLFSMSFFSDTHGAPR